MSRARAPTLPGPLSFMDIYDKMCFTVSSAGGRRGAQMGTFDVGHPDVLEFIRAKRENGRLRQFNLSLLITDEFMQAVKSDGEWQLAFPLARNEYETERPDLADTAKFVWREWPRYHGLRRERGGPGRLQDLQDPAGAPGVGSHHVLDLRFRGARLHLDRPGQRDEQQLVDGEHPRHQSLRRTASAAVRVVPPGLGQSDQIRRRSVHRGCALRLGHLPQGGEDIHPHAGQRGRNQRPAARAAAQRDPAQAPPRHGIPRPGLDHHHAVHEVRLEEIRGLHPERVARDGARRLGGRTRRWRAKKARRRS